jgi:hypothetical protein
MIRPNNPEIDTDELRARVAADAARIRASQAAGEWEGAERPLVVARLQAVTSLLVEAEKKNRIRREWPRRFAFLARTGPLGRALLRLWNYQFKEQREKDALILAALRCLALDAQADRQFLERHLAQTPRPPEAGASGTE